MRIIYLGTPEFAVAPLAALLEAGFEVVAVVTAEDKPAGRGLSMQMSAVKQFAISKNLLVLQPQKLKDPEFLAQIADLKPDVQFVVAFRMMPEVLWNFPPLGTYNVHASLLPNYRGAAPIHRAVMNGEKETGVTTFKLRHEIDTGDICLQAKTNIGEDETTGILYDRLMKMGADLLVETAKQLQSGEITLTRQELSGNTKHAPKIFKPDCLIDWQNSLDQIHNQIRGLNPFPSAYCMFFGVEMKIHMSKKEVSTHELPFGTLVVGKTLMVAVNGGFLHLLEIQLAGKKRMDFKSFLAGYRFPNVDKDFNGQRFYPNALA